MSKSVVQNINQAKSDLLGIKEAIIGKGVEIPDGTATSEFAEKIESIQTGITPAGTLQITENGTHDVTEYAAAEVNTPQASGTINITQNGTIDVADYANAEVTVEGDFSDATVREIIQGNVTSFTELALPKGINGQQTIRPYAFYGVTSLNKISIVNWIAFCAYCFANCSNTNEMRVIVDGSRYIDHITFYGDAFKGTEFKTFVLDAKNRMANNNTIKLNCSITGYEYSDAYTSRVFPIITNLVISKGFKLNDVDPTANGEPMFSNISNIYYEGTEEEFNSLIYNNLVNENDKNKFNAATKHFNYTGDGSEL